MYLTWTIASYFVAAGVLWLFNARLRRWFFAVAAAPFAAQITWAVLVAAGGGPDGGFETIDWIPALGVELAFRIDMFTVILTLLVASIGLLILIYSQGYLAGAERRSRFLTLMVLFTGGMAGIVASDNLFGLFVFWEVTTVASFLLIGFDDERADARSAALQAVLTTTMGGLAMLGGFVLLAAAAGSSSISTIVAAPPAGTMVTIALVLVFVGAFTKSAQFPFQFWLPNAMAAPTPASAFLHSATMVKAGIVLLLLLAPGFSGETIWKVGVTGVGLATMVAGALQAMRQHDLKLLLAHGTVSQLGFMTALIGVGQTGAAMAVLIAHAIFKAALFLIVGIIDKATGTRDIRRISGLRRQSPWLAVTAAAAAMSMAGIPPLLGFVTKEAAYDLLIADGVVVVLGIIAVASAVTVAYSLRFWIGAFGTGSPSAEPTQRLGILPTLGGPAVALAGASIVLGLFPAGLGEAVATATGGTVKLLLWPGWKPALLVSMVVVAAGIGLHVALRHDERLRRVWDDPPLRLPSGSDVYAAMVRGLNRTADGVTGVVQNGALPVYLAVILSTVLVVPAVAWSLQPTSLNGWTAANGATEVVLVAVIILAATACIRVQRRMAAALLLGVVGFAVAGIYVSFGAPDLALTQVLIETFTVALFAFVLARLPRRFGADPGSISRRVRIVVAVLSGLFVTGAALVHSSVQPDRPVAEFYSENAVAAGGSNVVNVILTDFRALDTLGEITVLLVAAVGVGALVRSTGRRRAVRADG